MAAALAPSKGRILSRFRQSVVGLVALSLLVSCASTSSPTSAEHSKAPLVAQRQDSSADKNAIPEPAVATPQAVAAEQEAPMAEAPPPPTVPTEKKAQAPSKNKPKAEADFSGTLGLTGVGEGG